MARSWKNGPIWHGLKGHVLGITAAPPETSGMIRWGCDSAVRIQKVVEKIHVDWSALNSTRCKFLGSSEFEGCLPAIISTTVIWTKPRFIKTDRTWNPSERNSLHNKSHDICISHKPSKVRHSQLNYRERRKASAPWEQYPVSHQLGDFCQHDTALWGRVSSIHPSYPTDWKTDISWKTVNCKDFLYCPKNRPLTTSKTFKNN